VEVGSVEQQPTRADRLALHIKNSYILDTHSSIAIIFGRNLTETVGNHNIVYFPTSPK